jgi:uncharacterized protein (TIGR03083 family)
LHDSGDVDGARFADCLAEEYALLRDAAASADLGTPVPSCPGWMMGNLVQHVAEVYLHKVAVMRTGRWPRPWPPAELAAEARLALLGRAYGELTAEFAARDVTQAITTWYEPDETVGFWLRRMAQETVIHRIDAELAAGLPSARVPGDLALDGVDEVLVRFLGYFSLPGDFSHLPDADGASAIVVSSGGRNWTVSASRVASGAEQEVTVEEGTVEEVTVGAGAADDPVVTVSAEPDAMLRWLWGRAGDGAVTVTGAPAWADYLRRMLVATTQ